MSQRYTLEYGLGAQDGVKRPFLQVDTGQKFLASVYQSKVLGMVVRNKDKTIQPKVQKH